MLTPALVKSLTESVPDLLPAGDHHHRQRGRRHRRQPGERGARQQEGDRKVSQHHPCQPGGSDFHNGEMLTFFELYRE